MLVSSLSSISLNFLHRILYRSLYYPLLAGLLALVIFLMTGQPGFSMTNQDTRETVRVGYFNNGDFMQKAMGKDFVGYDIEYYHIIASYMGFNIQFVEFSTLDKALSALDNGDIKVLSGLARTPDREKKYLVSNLKMCTAHIAVQTRADDDRFSAADTASMDELRCGVLKGSNMVPWYSSWCQSVGITPHIVEFDTLAQRNFALFFRSGRRSGKWFHPCRGTENCRVSFPGSLFHVQSKQLRAEETV